MGANLCPTCLARQEDHPRGVCPGPPRHGPLLTDDEREVIHFMGQVANLLAKIVADGPTRGHDLDELCLHVHAIQRTVGSQAAARAYPSEFRALGSTLRREDPSRTVERPNPTVVTDNHGKRLRVGE